MFINILRRILCTDKRLLRRLAVTSVVKSNNVFISPIFNVTKKNFPKVFHIENKKLTAKRMHYFKKFKDLLATNEKYKNEAAKTMKTDEFIDPVEIERIKSMNWLSLSSAECIKLFERLSENKFLNNANSMNDQEMQIFSALVGKCWDFSDESLLILLRCLEQCPKINLIKIQSHPVYLLLEKIDHELVQRSDNWTVDETLKYCDYIVTTFPFYSKFMRKSLYKFTDDVSNLSITNMVQIMGYLFVYYLPESRIMTLQPYFQQNFDKLSIEEITVICNGFFGQQICITSEQLLYDIMQKVIDNIDSINDICLATCLKTIRHSFSSSSECLSNCANLLEALIPKVPTLLIYSLTRVSHLAANSLIYNPRLVTAISERFEKAVRNEKVRIKDMERLVFLLTSFNHPSSEILYNLVVEEMSSPSRDNEIRNFPRMLGIILRHLLLSEVYPVNLISRMMSDEHMTLSYGSDRSQLGVEYLILDQSLEIEVPHYTGPRLSNQVLDIMVKNNITIENPWSFASQSMKSIIEIINDLFKSKDAACVYRILPHFTNRDVILCLDEQNNAIPADIILNQIETPIKRIPEEYRNGQKWIAIIFATQSHFARTTHQFSGVLHAKLRQLRKVGFEPIVIPFDEWKKRHYASMHTKFIRSKLAEYIPDRFHSKAVEKI